MPFLDLHAHYPMHTRFPPRHLHGPPPAGKKFEFWIANLILNFRGGQPRVTLDELLAGAEGGIASVLYSADDEFFHDAIPLPGAFDNLIAQMNNVEAEVAGRVKVVKNPAELRNCLLKTGEKFLFHCVEGAFCLGGKPVNVDVLAKRGVAYVIIAHLFFRSVATCENGLPFVPDCFFRSVLNPAQDPAVGLTQLGEEIVDRLFEKGILVDITHCSRLAQQKIFEIARDHENAPVISSHTGVRGTSNYPLNISRETVNQIVAAKGVIGVILSSHWLRQPLNQLFGSEGIRLLFDAIDCLHQWTGSYDYIAIGSDLDGFIIPIKDCEAYSETRRLEHAIRAKYKGEADKILYGNALDVLERGWKGV